MPKYLCPLFFVFASYMIWKTWIPLQKHSDGNEPKTEKVTVTINRISLSGAAFTHFSHELHSNIQKHVYICVRRILILYPFQVTVVPHPTQTLLRWENCKKVIILSFRLEKLWVRKAMIQVCEIIHHMEEWLGKHCFPLLITWDHPGMLNFQQTSLYMLHRPYNKIQGVDSNL